MSDMGETPLQVAHAALLNIMATWERGGRSSTADGERMYNMASEALEAIGPLPPVCDRCGDTKLVTLRGMCGGVEMDCDDQPCPECEDMGRKL